ncbi:hypothetical protein TWF281_007294 [Arthrobotrys megalospora]
MAALKPRQVIIYDDDYGWWYSDTAIIIKWTIGAIIFAIIIAYFGGGYIHAKNRMSKGLEPLSYHRWMVRRQMPQAYPSHFNGNAGGYGNYGGYAEPYQPPPPVYNPTQGPPPSYYPDNMIRGDIPLNPTKTNPNQNYPGQQWTGVTGGEASGSGPRP